MPAPSSRCFRPRREGPGACGGAAAAPFVPADRSPTEPGRSLFRPVGTRSGPTRSSRGSAAASAERLPASTRSAHAATPVKSRGVVYTPEPIVERILDEAGLRSSAELAGASVCDPACGDGAFLVPLAKRILRALPRKEALASLERMTGVDRDPAALAACRARLRRVVSRADPEGRLRFRLLEKDVLDEGMLSPLYGRFTHLVGNPPYVRVQNLEAAGRRRITGRFRLVRGATDLYLVFFELGLRLLQPGGRLAFITPSSWLRSDSGAPLRAELTRRHRVVRVLDYGSHQAFPSVTTYTAITVIEKDGAPAPAPMRRFDGSRFAPGGEAAFDPAAPGAPWIFFTAAERGRLERLRARGPRLGEVADIHVGLQNLADEVFILPRLGGGGDLEVCRAPDGRRVEIESRFCRPVVKASVMKEGMDPVDRIVVWPYDAGGRLLPERVFADSAPRAWRWLRGNRARLLRRDKGNGDRRKWYGFGRSVSIVSGFGRKLITSGMNRRPNFQAPKNEGATFYSGYCVKPAAPMRLSALLDALNSDEMEFFVRKTSRPYQGGWMSYAKSFIADFPVPESLVGGRRNGGRPARFGAMPALLPLTRPERAATPASRVSIA